MPDRTSSSAQQKSERIVAAPEIVTSDERLTALRNTGLLDSAPEPEFDRLTALARRLLSAPVTLMSLVDAERQFFKSFQGLGEPWASRRGTPISHSFCQHVVGSGDALIIEDARNHPLVHDNPAIADLGVIAYLGVPLITPNSQVLGSFCAIDHEPRTWTPQNIADLTDFAAVAAVEIASRQHLEQKEFTEQRMHFVINEMDHRSRNLLTVVKAIAHQTGRNATSIKKFLDAFGSRLDCLAAAHAVLIDREYENVGLREIARASLAAFTDRIRLDLPDRTLEPGVATAMALVLNELATNALKYGALSVPQGSVTLAAEVEPELLCLSWCEQGGPPADPPDARGVGIGMVQNSLSQYGGKVELDWRRDGLICRLRLPNCRETIPKVA